MQHPKASRPLVEDLSFDDGGRKQDFPWGRVGIFFFLPFLFFYTTFSLEVAAFQCLVLKARQLHRCIVPVVVSRLKDEQPVMPAKTFAGGPNSDMC